MDVAYEVDLFGRLSRRVEAARGDVGAADADADAVRVTIVSDTVQAYADAVSSAERIAVAERIVALLDQSLTLTEKRHQIGLANGLDTARIAALRDQRRADIPTLQAERQDALFRDGITGALGEKGVDMTLRLDNARALPTYPQPPQQQQAA